MNYIQKARSILAEKINVEEICLTYIRSWSLRQAVIPNLLMSMKRGLYGKIRPIQAINHSSRFPKLTPEVRVLDRKYVEAIQETAREISREG